MLSLSSTQVRCLVGQLGLSGIQVLLVPTTVSRLTNSRGECLVVTVMYMLGLMFPLCRQRVR